MFFCFFSYCEYFSTTAATAAAAAAALPRAVCVLLRYALRCVREGSVGSVVAANQRVRIRVCVVG
jgi:hypothetical protein